MRRYVLLLFIIFNVIHFVYSNDEDSLKTETNAKTGWTFGAIPAISFDTDIGFKYGGVINFFYYGDGTTYPRYWHSVYLEWSQTTKGSGINQIILDSDSLIKNIRTFVEFSYLTEKALDFYGFNGFESYYNPVVEDTLSRMFYRQERKMLRLRGDLLGNIGDSPFKWFAGLEYNNIKLDTIDITRLNKGLDDDKKLPSVNGGLYGNMADWGLIPEDQVNGGTTTLLKVGLVYDTRDKESNPNRGVWTEVQFLSAPEFIGNDYAYSRLILIHRQYFPFIYNKLVFAYRLNYQGKLSGQMPSYMLPFIYNSPPSLTRDGMGGSKTVRGALRNRIVGEDYLFGNFELRWKFIERVILKQNIDLVWNFFFDAGKITRKFDLENTLNIEALDYLNSGSTDKFHYGAGAGLKFVLNDNFVVSLDYGIPLDAKDGDRGFYMGLNFLF